MPAKIVVVVLNRTNILQRKEVFSFRQLIVRGNYVRWWGGGVESFLY